MKKIIFGLIMLLPLTGCGSTPSEGNVIYTSFYPLYDFARRIAGDLYEVKNVTPPGAEPHDYELTNADLVGMSSAKVVFVNGLGLEHWTDQLPASIKEKVKATTSDITPLQINGVNDPHVWLNPLNAIAQMESICNTLISIDSDHKATFQSNFDQAKAQFLALDTECSASRKNFNQTYFAVNHAAFGYLADRYDLTQVYVSGLTPEEEPSAKDMENIAATIKEHGITTIFTEELASSEVAEAIARETGAKLETLNPLEGLTEDQLKTEDYLSVMKSNFSKLKEACA